MQSFYVVAIIGLMVTKFFALAMGAYNSWSNKAWDTTSLMPHVMII